MHQSRTFDVFVAVGLVTYGIVHLLIAWIAVRIAWTGRQGNDSQDAALAAMAQTVYGEALLWVTAVGLAALTLWQMFETIWRRTPDEGLITKTFGRVGSVFSAAAYLTLGISAARVALAGRAAREGRRVTEDSTALEETVLRVAVVIIGIVLVVLAARSVYRGFRRRFVDDLKVSVNGRIVLGSGRLHRQGHHLRHHRRADDRHRVRREDRPARRCRRCCGCSTCRRRAASCCCSRRSAWRCSASTASPGRPTGGAERSIRRSSPS